MDESQMLAEAERLEAAARLERICSMRPAEWPHHRREYANAAR